MTTSTAKARVRLKAHRSTQQNSQRRDQKLKSLQNIIAVNFYNIKPGFQTDIGPTAPCDAEKIYDLPSVIASNNVSSKKRVVNPQS